MIEFIKNKGWTIINGNTPGGEEGEFTFIGSRGNSVINYIIVNEKMGEKVVKCIADERVNSDHTSINAYISLELKGQGANDSVGRGKG